MSVVASGTYISFDSDRALRRQSIDRPRGSIWIDADSSVAARRRTDGIAELTIRPYSQSNNGTAIRIVIQEVSRTGQPCAMLSKWASEMVRGIVAIGVLCVVRRAGMLPVLMAPRRSRHDGGK